MLSRKSATAILLLAVMVAGVFLVAYAEQQDRLARDPFSEFRAPNGSLVIPPGRLTPELARQLFAPRGTFAPWSHWGVRASAYPTASYVYFDARLPSAPRAARQAAPAMPDFIGDLARGAYDLIRGGLDRLSRDLLGLLSTFNYNITIKNNVLYNIGGYGFWVGSQGLKFKNSTGVERSDYSYRAMQVSFDNNYVNGINYYGASQDSGYTTWHNNTFTNLLVSPNAGAYWNIEDGWCPDGLGTQVDWFGGTNFTAQTANLHFGNNGCNTNPANVARQKLVWIRTYEGGTLNVKATLASYPAHYQDRGSTGFWGNTYPCVVEQTPTTAERWTNLPCNPMEDKQNYTNMNSIDTFAWKPVGYWNYTRAFVGPTIIPLRLKIDYIIPAGAVVTYTDLTTTQTVPYYIGSVNANITAGHNYAFTVTVPGGGGGGGGTTIVIPPTIAGFDTGHILIGVGLLLLVLALLPSAKRRARGLWLIAGVIVIIVGWWLG